MSLLLQSTYAIVDLLFIREIGQSAVAGLAISFQAFFMMLAISQVVAATALAGISQDYGAGRFDHARSSFATFSMVAAGIGSVAALIAFTFADSYVGTFTDDPVVHRLGVEYFQVNALTFVTQTLTIVFANSTRAAGDFHTPMKISALTVLLNIALDPLFIFGAGPVPAGGLEGAAWATILAQSVGLVIYTRRFSRPGHVRKLHWRSPLLERRIFKDLLTRGLPAGVQFFLISAVLGIILSAMKPYGSTWTAAAGGGFRVFQQALLPLVALASGTAAITGQNLGAGHFGRMRRTASVAFRAGLTYGLVGAILIYCFSGQIGKIFMEDAAGIAAATLYFQWTGPSLVAFGFILVSMYILQACGKSIFPLFASLGKLTCLSAMVFLLIPALDLGVEAVFAASMVGNFVEGLCGFIFTVMMFRNLKEPAEVPIKS